LLEEDENVINFQSWVGQSGVADFNALFQGTANQVGDSIAEIRVNLVDKHERTTSSIDLVYNLRPKVEAIRVRYPEAKIRLVEDPPGPPLRAMVVAEVYGPDREGLRILAAQVKEAFCETWDMVDLTDSEPVDVREHHVMPDREKAALSGVSVAQIAQVLQLVYGGDIVSRAHPSDEKNPVSVRAYVPRRYEVDPTRLDRIFVDNVEGRPVPVSELVRIESARADRPVQRKDNERVSFVGGEMARSVALYAVLDLDRRVDGILTPDGRPLTTGNLKFVSEAPDVIDGYRLLWEGEMRMELDVYRDLGLALGAALTVVFLMLVAYYKSFLIPLVAMSSVPLGIIGIFPGHWLMGVDFSATSIVGIVALSGVVVRNSLLIIDFIQDNMKKGMPLKEAAAQAGAVRLRPILLVALAIVFGSVIMVADPVFGGLAISLIFGTVVSASFTVFVVPLLYCLVASRQNVIP
jgi:multidrug efflux pump subunit AcrB